jgi:hypothetical protein
LGRVGPYRKTLIITVFAGLQARGVRWHVVIVVGTSWNSRGLFAD